MTAGRSDDGGPGLWGGAGAITARGGVVGGRGSGGGAGLLMAGRSNEYIRYKEALLKPDSGLGHTTVKHHLDDLRTLFKFASKNRSFPNPTDDVTRLQRKNGGNKIR